MSHHPSFQHGVMTNPTDIMCVSDHVVHTCMYITYLYLHCRMLLKGGFTTNIQQKGDWEDNYAWIT